MSHIATHCFHRYIWPRVVARRPAMPGIAAPPGIAYQCFSMRATTRVAPTHCWDGSHGRCFPCQHEPTRTRIGSAGTEQPSEQIGSSYALSGQAIPLGLVAEYAIAPDTEIVSLTLPFRALVASFFAGSLDEVV